MGDRFQTKRAGSPVTGRLRGKAATKRASTYPIASALQLKALQQASARYTTFYNLAPVAYVTLDDAGRVRELNVAAARLLQLDAASVARSLFVSMVEREDTETFLAHLARCRKTARRSACELRLRIRRKKLAVQMLSVRYEENGQSFIRCALIDITDRKKNEIALREAKEFAESIVQTIRRPLVVLDHRLHVVSANRSFYETFKTDAAGAGGKSFEAFLNLWWSGNALRAELDKVLNQNAVLDDFLFESEIPNLGPRSLLINARALRRGRNHSSLILLALEDITERRRAAEEVQKLNAELENRVEMRTMELQRANEQLQQTYNEMQAFCYTIAHDLRAPLRAMESFSRILLEDYAAKLDAEGQEYTRRISGAARRMDNLINDLLDYARITRIELPIGKVDLKYTVADVISHHDEEICRRNADVSVDGELPMVLGHGLIVERAVTNLLANALKFVSPGFKPVVRIWAELKDGWVKLWIQDNGIGIAPEHQKRIFKVFERLHCDGTYPGTGVGLAIVQRGIERTGGQVGVDSELNGGSRFWIQLPAAPAEHPIL